MNLEGLLFKIRTRSKYLVYVFVTLFFQQWLFFGSSFFRTAFSCKLPTISELAAFGMRLPCSNCEALRKGKGVSPVPEVTSILDLNGIDPL